MYVSVPVVTSIHAGRGIPDDLLDWEITKFREVRLPPGCDPTASYILAPVDGPSLIFTSRSYFPTFGKRHTNYSRQPSALSSHALILYE